MSQISKERIQDLCAVVEAEGVLRRLLGEIEQLHRVVFHDNRHADWSRVRDSAAQVLIADIVSRHRGEVRGVLDLLHGMQEAGRSWDDAVTELATKLHSYYTTPLGIVMRQDLFGEQAVFFTPDAYTWTERQRGGSAGGGAN